MLRFNNSIRLTVLDRQLYARIAGTPSAAPRTVDDYNRGLEHAARLWGNGQSPGERLLARMALALMLDPLDPADVLGERQLGQATFSCGQ